MQFSHLIEDFPNGSFPGRIPSWKTGDLVALVLAEVISTASKNWSSTSTMGSTFMAYQQLILNHITLEDETQGHRFIWPLQATFIEYSPSTRSRLTPKTSSM